MQPVRVTRTHRCPACGKGDWCLIGDKWTLCMRVESDKPKTLADGSIGWLHPTGDMPLPTPPPIERESVTLDVAGLLKYWEKFLRSSSMAALSDELGVSLGALETLECTKTPYHQAWAFPMRDGSNTYCGIRIRNSDGEKWAERGSHQGLFIPQTPPEPMVILTEGPTDAAAALTLGYWAIGRPSCCGGIPQIQVALKRLQTRRAVIVADLDDAGLRGARTLQEHLPIASAVLVCPAKDLRSAIRSGLDRVMMDAMIGQLVWRRP